MVHLHCIVLNEVSACHFRKYFMLIFQNTELWQRVLFQVMVSNNNSRGVGRSGGGGRRRCERIEIRRFTGSSRLCSGWRRWRCSKLFDPSDPYWRSASPFLTQYRTSGKKHQHRRVFVHRWNFRQSYRSDHSAPIPI